jgi:ectoine hydroxylase-related dioxygenase (phytanoyl-CoA dioxygenase family)
VWIPLDDVTPEGGGLVVLPGAHVLGRLRYCRVTEDDYDDAEFNARYSVFAVQHPGTGTAPWLGEPFAFRMRAGGLEIHDPCLPHSSEPNTTATPRRVLILRYQPTTEPLAQSKLVNPRTGETSLKCNYVVRGRYGGVKASRNIAAARLDRHAPETQHACWRGAPD